MADHRITDFVDQAAIDRLKELNAEMQNIKVTYVEVANALLRGLNIRVSGVADIDAALQSLAELQNRASRSTEQLNRNMAEQGQIIANTTNTISRQLMEQEKLNEKTRSAYTRQKDVKEVLTQAVSSYEDMTRRIAEITIAQGKLNDAKAKEKKEYEKGNKTYDEYSSALQGIIKQQQALAAEKSQLESYTRSEAKENANASSSYNAMSQELLRLKKAYKELDEEGRNSEIGQSMMAEIKELGAHLKDMDASMGDFQRNVGDYAIACNNGIVVTEDLNRVLGLQAGTIAGCIEQNKALQDAKAKLDTADANYGETLDRINAKIVENNLRISDVGAIMGKSATTIAEAEEQNKLLSEALKLVDVTAEGATAKVNAINAKIAENNKLIQDNSGKQQSIKKDLKEMVLEIANLTVQYRNMSDEERNSAEGKALAKHINELTEKAGELKDAVTDANNAITKAASDTRLFDQFSGGIQLMIDGFGLSQGAAEMLGIAEGDLVEIQAKLQASIAASNGLSKIQAQLQKESALMQGVANIQTKAAAAAERMKAAATGKGIVATKAATVAQRAFNIVANANPYVLLATGIVAVGAALWAFVSKTKDAEKAQARLNDEMERASKAIDKIESDCDFNVKIARAAGESEEALRKMRLEAARAANELAYANMSKVLADPNATKEQREEAIKLEEDTYKRIQAILDEGTEAYIKSLHEKDKAAEDEEKRRQEAAAREAERLRNSAKTARDIESDLHKFRLTSLNAQLSAAEEFSDEWTAIMESIAQTTYSINLFDVKSQLAKALEEAELSYKVGKIAKEQYDETVKSLTEAANAQILALNVQLQEELMDIQDKIAEHEQELQTERMEAIEKEYANEQAVRDAKYAKDEQALKEKHLRDLEAAGNNAEARAALEKQYQNDSAALAEQYAIDTAQAQADMYKKILGECQFSADERERIEKELAKMEADLTQKTLDASLEANKRQYESEEELAKKQEEAHKRRMDRAQQWLRLASDSMNAISDLANAVFSAKVEMIEREQEASNKQIEEEEARNEVAQERISELVEKKVITQEEGEARKRAAEAKTAQKRQEIEKKNEELEKKKQQMQYRQAVWDKANKLAQAGISTALGIMQTIASVGFPAAIPMIAVVGALGALQLATILATPIPKYKSGTEHHKGGLAIVGDGGKAEVVYANGEYYVTPDKPTLVDIPQGAKVYPDADRFIDESVGFNPHLLVAGSRESTSVNVDFTRLERKIEGSNELLKAIAYQQRGQQRAIADALYHTEFEKLKCSL